MDEPENPLAAWCRELEGRLAEAHRERGELAAESERLAARAAELTAILKSLEEAFLLGRLRAAGKLAEAPQVPPGPPASERPSSRFEPPTGESAAEGESTRVFPEEE